MHFILASGSPRRKDILRDLGIDFTVCPAGIDEIMESILPERVPVINAVAKAEHVAVRYPADIVMGADTVIEFAGQVIGKPADKDDARRMLLSLSGQTHAVVTAVCLVCADLHLRCVFCETTAVTFRALSPAVVDEYLDKVNVLDKAGAYAIQEYGDMLVEQIAGPLDNVVGLPATKLKDALYCCGLASLMLNDAPSR